MQFSWNYLTEFFFQIFTLYNNNSFSKQEKHLIGISYNEYKWTAIFFRFTLLRIIEIYRILKLFLWKTIFQEFT